MREKRDSERGKMKETYDAHGWVVLSGQSIYVQQVRIRLFTSVPSWRYTNGCIRPLASMRQSQVADKRAGRIGHRSSARGML